MSWGNLAGWWRRELGSDPSYTRDVDPLLDELLMPSTGERILDVGCGEGRMMARLAGESSAFGVDISLDLLQTAKEFGPVVRGRLPGLRWARDSTFDGAVVSLVLEHLADEGTFFADLGRVVKPGGRLALVINHPIFTAPESAPIQEDDEVLWRPGRYFDRGHTDERAGDGWITFHHRTMAELMNAASAGGWDLLRMVERGATESQIERHPSLGEQRHIPRLLGAAWRRR